MLQTREDPEPDLLSTFGLKYFQSSIGETIMLSSCAIIILRICSGVEKIKLLSRRVLGFSLLLFFGWVGM